MKQTIHILKKDLRRFSWDICGSLLLWAVYAWCQPATWEPLDMYRISNGTSAYWRYLGSNFSGFLLVLAWTAMLVRLIFEESLTGDRQFWLTRPYRWPSLLAAKVLFFITVVHVPLLMVQVGLLHAAGFSPLHYFSRLFYLHLYLAACYLCVAALAVVAGTGRQFARAVIVVLIFLVIWLYLGSTSFRFSLSDEPSPWDGFVYTILLTVCIIVIVRQYALRKTVQARWILFAAGIVLTVIAAVQPKWTLNQAEYPQLSSGAASNFNVELAPPTTPKPGAPASAGGKEERVFVDLKLTATGAPAGMLVQASAGELTLRTPDGTSWNSGWQRLYTILEPEDGLSSRALPNTVRLPVWVDQKFFDRAKEVPVTAHVVLAATLFRDKEIPGTARAGEYQVPGVGFCTVGQRSFSSVWCRSAADEMPLFGVKQNLYKSCSGETREPVLQDTAWAPNGSSFEFGLSPVNSVVPYFDRQTAEARSLIQCPNTPVTFRLPEKIQHFRVEKDFAGLKLADYAEQ